MRAYNSGNWKKRCFPIRTPHRKETALGDNKKIVSFGSYGARNENPSPML